MLDFSSLKKSLLHLKNHYQFAIEEKDDGKQFAFETAAIKSFEYTYEVAIKMIKRFLEENLPSSEEVDLLSFKNFIRIAAEKGLISDPEIWFIYREKRNVTSHAYDNIKADKVFATIPNFTKEIEHLIKKLENVY